MANCDHDYKETERRQGVGNDKKTYVWYRCTKCGDTKMETESK